MPPLPTLHLQALLHLLAHFCALARHHFSCVHLWHSAGGLLAARDCGFGEFQSLLRPGSGVQPPPLAPFLEERVHVETDLLGNFSGASEQRGL